MSPYKKKDTPISIDLTNKESKKGKYPETLLIDSINESVT